MKPFRFDGQTAGAPLPSHLKSLQAALLQNLSVAQMRSLSPLPEDAQRIIDQAVVRVGRDRLVVVADLIDAGLTYNVPDALSVMEVQWDAVSESGHAQRTMNPSARGENQLPDRVPNRIPLYLTTDDFFFGIRTLRASQRVGMPLDTTLVEQATRNVNEAIEDAAINGAQLKVHGYDTPGLLTAPNVNTFTITNWMTETGENILAQVLSMIGVAHSARRFGPYNLYIPTNYGVRLQNDFKANGELSIMARLMQVQSGGRTLNIRVADQLPANTVVLVQMTSDIIDLVDGQRPVTVPWTSPDGFTLYWLVMAIQVPRVKTDYAQTSGIVVGRL